MDVQIKRGRPSDESAAQIAKALKALGDPHRLRIFSLLLTQGRLCVGDLVMVLDQPQPSISRQLGVLREAGLVTAERQGTWMHYAVADQGCCGALVAALAPLLLSEPSFAETASRAASLAAAGGCCPDHPSCTPATRGGR